MGAGAESQVNAFIDKVPKVMPGAGEPNVAEILKEAEAVLAEGDPATAAQIYAEVLAADPTNIAALAGLGQCYLATGAPEQATQTLAMAPESKRSEPAGQAVGGSLDFAQPARERGPAPQQVEKSAPNP